jgi:hypothetical protein
MKGTTMAMYLSKFTHTPETWARLLANPEDRRSALAPVLEAAALACRTYSRRLLAGQRTASVARDEVAVIAFRLASADAWSSLL